MTAHKPEHEHLPHSLIVDLKHDVEALKRKLTQPDTKTHELILEIESLKDAVHQLNVIFEKALKEMKEEDITKTFHALMEKVKVMAVQNETIAQGMVALSDKLDTFMTRQLGRSIGQPAQVQHSMGAPAMSGRFAPKPEMSMPSMSSASAGFPPPPPGPSGRKRVGLF
ncbi:MAG: hypothetical protein Q8R47_03655 [Nanoarchaeota archaeon]|nr:hypothetical protein [Nanoarchaeota archaeon]